MLQYAVSLKVAQPVIQSRFFASLSTQAKELMYITSEFIYTQSIRNRLNNGVHPDNGKSEVGLGWLVFQR